VTKENACNIAIECHQHQSHARDIVLKRDLGLIYNCYVFKPGCSLFEFSCNVFSKQIKLMMLMMTMVKSGSTLNDLVQKQRPIGRGGGDVM